MYSVNPPVLETLNAAQSESYTIRKEKVLELFILDHHRQGISE